jgi:hypothetical protein
MIIVLSGFVDLRPKLLDAVLDGEVPKTLTATLKAEFYGTNLSPGRGMPRETVHCRHQSNGAPGAAPD